MNDFCYNGSIWSIAKAGREEIHSLLSKEDKNEYVY